MLLPAYLLWLFLGVLGGHRFYPGRIGGASAMLALALLEQFLITAEHATLLDYLPSRADS